MIWRLEKIVPASEIVERTEHVSGQEWRAVRPDFTLTPGKGELDRLRMLADTILAGN